MTNASFAFAFLPSYRETVRGLDEDSLEALATLVQAVKVMCRTSNYFDIRCTEVDQLPAALRPMHKYFIPGNAEADQVLGLARSSSSLAIDLQRITDQHVAIIFNFYRGETDRRGSLTAHCDLTTHICTITGMVLL